MKESGTRKLWIAVAAIVLVAPAAALASLESVSSEEVRLSVSYADLDLSKAAGVETLYLRLKAAATRACGPTTLRQAGSLEQIMNNRDCAKRLLDRAVQKADNTALTKLHLA